MPGRPVAKAVHHVERRLHLGQRRAEPLEQARAGLGRRDAARGAVEQADAELRLQPAHRLAQARGAAAAGAGAVAKAAGARHGDEGVQVAEIDWSLFDISAQPVPIVPDYRRKRGGVYMPVAPTKEITT